jgi:hypothetical protein
MSVLAKTKNTFTTIARHRFTQSGGVALAAPVLVLPQAAAEGIFASGAKRFCDLELRSYGKR